MKRREFNKKLGLGIAATTMLPFQAFPFNSSNSLDRIAMSTVNFRERFHQTRSKDLREEYDALTLLEIPKYFSERFSLKNVEFWSKHFESTDKDYLEELKEAIQKQKSTLINIQLDESYQIGATDETERMESLALVLKWVEVAKTLGSGGIRVNPGNGNPKFAIEALKIINDAAKKTGLILMVENHFGMEMNPNLHLKIIKEVGGNCYSLPDFGNYSDENRYESLRKIMPLAYQISAKTIAFDDKMNHLSFDFDQCMQIAKENEFKGIYSVEQWSRETVTGREEAIADWMIEKVKGYL